MNIPRYNKKTVLDISLVFLLVYLFWSYIFTHTIFNSNTMIYACFMLLLVGFGYSLLNGCRTLKVDVSIALWCPFVIYTALGYVTHGDIEHFSYWLIALFILFMTNSKMVGTRAPWKIVFTTGIIMAFGVFFQLLFTDFYNSHIAILYTNANQVLYWGRAYGLAGFTYQLDTTAIPIIYSIGFYMYLRKAEKQDNKYIRVAILAVMIIAVFLTGKRMLSLVSVVAPLIVYICSQRSSVKKFGIMLISVLLITAALFYININAERLIESTVLRRVAQTFINLRLGVDTTTGRDQLYDLAISAFRSSPILGIGIGNFVSQLGAYTATHNTYLQILCEQGVVGFILFIIPLLYCYISSITLLRKMNDCDERNMLKWSLFIQTVYILYSFSGNTNINLFGYIMYFLAVSLLADCKKIYASEMV